MSKISWYRIKLVWRIWENNSAGGKRITPYIVRLCFLFIVGLSLLAGFFVWLDPPIYIYDNQIYFLYMFMSCFIFSSNMGKERITSYLLLPASTTEKIIAHLIQAIGIPTLMLAILIPETVLLQGLVNLRAGQSMMSYMPVLETLTLNNFLAGLLMQAVCGFSALTFRKIPRVIHLFVAYPFLVIAFVINMLKREGEISGTVLLLINGISLCLTILVWIANYYRLKKREIA